ncbi:MAG: PHP domain-containing protein [Treponema sp.]|nr:PHP domain-containing protein [Treponema sp.]
MPVLADFHNHSCLSPCGSLELSPRVLAELASRKNINVLALTDHNSSLNCPAFARVCPPLGILPVFGMELTTSEEIHVLCLFSSLEASMEFSEYAYSILFPFPNDPEVTGDQVYVDENDLIMGTVANYLVNPLDLSVDEIGSKAGGYGGIVIPAHVDRPYFSMTSQLGVVVKGPWAAVECMHIPPVAAGSPVDTLGYPLTTSSDAHHPEQVGRRSFMLDAEMEALAPDGLSGGIDLAVLRDTLEKRPR